MYRATRRRGLATLELAVILPLFVLLVFGLIEFGMVFYVRHHMVHAARDAARHLATEGATGAEARAVALNRLAPINASFSVAITVPPPAASGGDVTVAITVPRNEVSLGIAGIAGATDVRTQVTMRKEDFGNTTP